MAGKRGNNEGTIRKRSDGRWEARMSLPDGKQKSVYGKTRQEVQRKLAQLLRDKEQGVLPSHDRQTVEQYLTFWLDLVKHEIDASSYKAYRYHVKRLIKTLGKVVLSSLTAQQIQAFYALKLEGGLAPTTTCTMHAVLRHALKDAVRLGILVRNVTDAVKPPKFEPKPKNVLTAQQARTLIEAAKGDWYEALYPVVLSTGMREGELFAMEWQDIDFTQGLLYVRQGLQQTEQGYILHDPKSKTSRRTIALSGLAIVALQEHKRRQDEYKAMLGSEWDSTYDFVFPNHFGRFRNPSSFLAKDFVRVMKKAGLPLAPAPGGIYFHDLRHTAATLLLAKGVHVKVVSEMLGHADISITLRLYAHVLPNMHRDAADKMNEILQESDRRDMNEGQNCGQVSLFDHQIGSNSHV